MLSAFQAQSIYELKPRDKAKIESLLTYGDRILVGLSTGALRIYRVNEDLQAEAAPENGDPAPASPSKKTKAIELLREEEKFSRKRIQQLAIIKEVNLLVSLSDDYVSLHDLQSCQLTERLDTSKGATCFTVTSNVIKDADTKVPTLVSRMAVGVKRKVLCWTWQDMEQLPDVVEVNMEATIKSLTWISTTRMVVGMDPGFSIVNIETQEVTAINKSAARTSSDSGSAEAPTLRFGAVSSTGMGYMGMGSWVPKPMATGLSDSEILLAKDVNTLFADDDGKPSEKRQVPWSFAPEAIGYSYPYLLALQSPERGSLQIRNPDTLSLLQTIAVPGAILLHVPPPNISLAHAGKRFLVASDRVIWRMNALSYDEQLSELVTAHRFDEAISLLTLLEDTLIDGKDEKIRETKIQKAISLFAQRKYRPSLDLFTEAEAPPERVVQLYPKEISGDLAAVEDDTSHGPRATDDSESRVIDAVKLPPATPSKSSLGRIAGGHARKDSDGESVRSSTRTDLGTGSAHKRTPSKKVANEQSPLEEALTGDDLQQAVRALPSFLTQARITIQKYLDTDGTLKEDPPAMDKETGLPHFAHLLPQSVFESKDNVVDWQGQLLGVARLVYTTLFRAYMMVSPSLAGPLFRIDNFCDPDVVQASLYENHRYNDLIDFLRGKKLHRQALELLVKFGQGEIEGEVPDGMSGPERTATYLKQLPPEQIDLILEYAAYPIREEPSIGMDIFLADTDNAERLPKEQIVEFLANIDHNLEIRYLEHIINELRSDIPDFHQKLVDRYLELLKSSETDSTERSSTKSKMEAFLRKSQHYNKAAMRRQLPTDEPIFFESRAIVLSALGLHEDALKVYVFQLMDYSKAEAYCGKIYEAEETATAKGLINGNLPTEKPSLHRAVTQVSKDKPNIFATLLGLYLRPPPGEEKRWPQALDLLSRHGSRLPASSTLESMPADLAVKELQDYFKGRLRHATSLGRQEKIIRSLEGVRLAHADHVLLFGNDSEVESGKLGGRNRRVRIADDDHCRVCHRRFGASAVRVMPDGEVVHYGCVGRRAQDAAARTTGTGWT